MPSRGSLPTQKGGVMAQLRATMFSLTKDDGTWTQTEGFFLPRSDGKYDLFIPFNRLTAVDLQRFQKDLSDELGPQKFPLQDSFFTMGPHTYFGDKKINSCYGVAVRDRSFAMRYGINPENGQRLKNNEPVEGVSAPEGQTDLGGKIEAKG